MIRFTKMQSGCSDFIVINNMNNESTSERFPELAAEFCRRRVSVGGDGLIVIAEPEKRRKGSDKRGENVRTLIYDASGKSVNFSENALLCTAEYCFRKKIKSGAGYLCIECGRDRTEVWHLGECTYRLVINDMRRQGERAALNTGTEIISCCTIKKGNEKELIFTAEYNNERTYKDLSRIGQIIKERGMCGNSDINFIRRTEKDCISVRTYRPQWDEFVYSCSTAAALAALIDGGKCWGRRQRLECAGGMRLGEGEYENWESMRILLTGEARMVYEGVIL